MEQLELNSFLLKIGNELESNEFEALKFVMKGFVTSAKCEETVQAFKYFEEMERLCLLSPTNFLVLKRALEAIGRPDLVKKIEGKEEYFATLFGEKIKDYNNLGAKDCDMVCDGIKEAATRLPEFFPLSPRSGQNTFELQEKLKLISSENGDDFQPQKIVDELQEQSAVDEPMASVKVEPSEINENGLPLLDAETPPRGPLHPVDTKAKATPCSQADTAKHKKLEPVENESNDTGNAEETMLESKPEKIKEPSDIIVPDGNYQELDDDVVTDGSEKDKGNVEGTKKGDKEKCTSKKVHPPSYEVPTADTPLQLKSYKKKGYSVVISNGQLCECTSEKGMVIMENGTTFSIAITNSNDYAAEVDVTFGGRYLGFWSMDAQQANPLIIEGSAWEKGKLTFTSDSPKSIPSSKAQHNEFEPSGRIKLEFKPEAMALFVQHVRSDKKHEILLTDFKTATVDDLKEEVNRTLWERLGIISCLIKDGRVLNEQNSIRSYTLKEGDIVQVLTNEEPMSIEPQGMDPFTIRVDPCHDSTKSVMETIAEKMRTPMKKQRLQVNGKDITETDPLAKIFLKSKKPVIKVVTDMDINIGVHLPSQEVKKVSIAWFLTVNELKRELQIPETGTILKLSDKQICGDGSKQLIDVGVKNGSEITVVSAQQKENQAPATHRGVKLSSLKKPGTTRGFGGFGYLDSHAPVSNLRGFPSGFRTFRGDPEEHESSDDFQEDEVLSNHLPPGLREGACVLRGDDSFANQFQLDTLERKFSKDKLKVVTLIIQLCSRSVGADTMLPSGAHYSGALGPMSTPYPPPVPE
ncbi:uncharacterized protein LOC144633138 isoform X2 [Oculina patagonica]